MLLVYVLCSTDIMLILQTNPFFWGVILRFKTSNIDVEVSLKKARNELLVPKPKIRMRTPEGKLVEMVRTAEDIVYMRNGKHLASELTLTDPETGESVDISEALPILKNYKYRAIDEDGKEVPKIKDEKKREILPVLYFVVQPDGSEQGVSPFIRNSVIFVPDENWVPSTSINGFAIYGEYEIFSDSPIAALKLFEEAERRLKADEIGITNFVHQEGFKQYYAFLCPRFREGKFVWLMKLSDAKPVYDHMQEPPVKVTVPIREAPTLKTLPPVQALVVASKKKQS